MTLPAALSFSPTEVGEGVPLRILVWAADPGQAERLKAEVVGPERVVRATADEREFAQWLSPALIDLVVAVDEVGLEAQAPMIRLPMIVLRRAGREIPPSLERKAYAVVGRADELGFAVDRFEEHARLAARAARRREPPRQCARCGRGYDPAGGEKGPARRFVRFGSISLCGACVEALRQLVREASSAFVEAEVRR